ncbi:glyoxylase/beta-lactamase superfamily II-like metal-dependent hydrolase [Desulfuromonas soudanensis]|uniref:Glyoxylase/beta-lactamase superfamily II-like metal-dependent hydrolase n=1 Tax=Desulfuromonas soudanensis TaxID=1603606 RepID=A0A0M5INK6_9BACT|nr:MBL fold metallo-hydrolase [Desulfuromonas soudanensis]ALC17186.1 glyoxylase/beta-lactamase superfamily II-like metal-dependent hydrolase [Desulfuromonas soudanensis]
MKSFILTCAALLLFSVPAGAAPPAFTVEKLGVGVFAAIATSGGGATGNAFFVVGDSYVVAGGAHLTKEAITGLLSAIGEATSLPLRYLILTHHHRGYSHIDFDIPPGVDVLMSWQTWKALESEVRKTEYPVLFYSDGLTLETGKQTVILTNMARGHSEGDTVVYLPDEGVLFASDLLYVGNIGYLGDGHMQEWVLALEFLQQLGARRIIPGSGPVATGEQLAAFKSYLRDFLTEVLAHIERGESLKETLRTFELPRYREYAGYDTLLKGNVERAYLDLKENLLP